MRDFINCDNYLILNLMGKDIIEDENIWGLDEDIWDDEMISSSINIKDMIEKTFRVGKDFLIQDSFQCNKQQSTKRNTDSNHFHLLGFNLLKSSLKSHYSLDLELKSPSSNSLFII